MDEEKLEVYFWEYCRKCKHRKKDEWEEPCCDCIEEPVNINSPFPLYRFASICNISPPNTV